MTAPISAASPYLVLDDVEVRYGRTVALRDVSIEIGRGEIVGLVGPNGAGKSTMMLAIAGVVVATKGEIRFKANSLAGLTPEQIVRRGIALVPEGRHIFARLTVEENLRIGEVGRHKLPGLDDDRAMIATLFPRLVEVRQRRAGLLSGGEQQMLAIARALLGAPDLLLLDEPSLGLAPALVGSMFTTLEHLREIGKTIVIVEQRVQRTLRLADRTYVLNGGQVRLELERGEPEIAERMANAYFGVSDALARETASIRKVEG